MTYARHATANPTLPLAMEPVLPDFAPLYAQLRALMEPYAALLDVKQDDDTALYLDTAHVQKNGKPLFFGAVQVKKAYVAYHLMPLYDNPELATSLSSELKARMHGKSCFNFKNVEPAVLDELAALTATAFASYEEQGFVDRGD